MVLMERYVIMNRKLKPGAAHHHSKSQDSFETLIKCAFLCLPLCEIRGVIKDEASTPHFCLYQQSVFKWIIYQDLVAKRRALALLICGSSTGEAGDLKGNYWYVLCCVCVCVRRQWEDAEIMVLLQVMYTDLDFIATFNIEPQVLQQFLFEVYRRYNNIPFHNFKHCFCVTQMVSACVCVCIIEWLFIRANHGEPNCVCNHELIGEGHPALGVKRWLWFELSQHIQGGGHLDWD